MKIGHSIVEYDNNTDRVVGDLLFVPEDYMEEVKKIAGVDADDPDAIYCYKLTVTEVLQISQIVTAVGKSILLTPESSYFLECYQIEEEDN